MTFNVQLAIISRDKHVNIMSDVLLYRIRLDLKMRYSVLFNRPDISAATHYTIILAFEWTKLRV